MSALSDFMGGGGGGFLPHKEFLNVTGTITLDLSKYSAFKVTQGAGDLTLNFIEDDPEIRGEADLFLAKNPAFNLTVNSDAILSISTGEFDLSSSSYKIISFDVSGQDNSPTGLVFNNDGSKMYVTGFASDSVHQYTLSTPFDLSTTSYDSISFGVSGETGTPQGLAFNNDGTKMYIIGSTNDRVYQYTLSTPFDLSSISYASISFDVSGQDTIPTGLVFNNDGSKMYVTGFASDSVHQYTLSTPFDLSTTSYDSVSFGVSGQDTNPTGLTFNSNGSKMYIIGSTNDSVHQYTLSTPFDLSTTSYDSISFGVSGEAGTPQGLAFNNDGTKMYVTGTASDSVYQYTSPTVNKVSQFGAFTGIQSEVYLYAI